MGNVKGQTYKHLREKQGVSNAAKEQLKSFIGIKKAILNALKDNYMPIAQLAEKLTLPPFEVTYHLMSLIKYGFIQ